MRNTSGACKCNLGPHFQRKLDEMLSVFLFSYDAFFNVLVYVDALDFSLYMCNIFMLC